jgi:type IV pilus assembly protein PilO
MKLQWPGRQGLRHTPVLSSHRPSVLGLSSGAVLLAVLGLSLPLATSDWLAESQALEHRRQELDASLTQARAKLRQVQAALSTDPAPAASGSAVAADHLELHRLALAKRLRVEVLKSADDVPAGAATRLQLRGSYGDLVAFVAAMARSEVAWGLQSLQLAAGEDRGHRLSLRLQALPVGAWMQAGRAEPVRLLALPGGADPFAAAPPPSRAPLSAAAVDPLANVPAQWRFEFAREREPLEALALRELSLTGTFRQGQSWVALLRSGTVIHTLKVGDYLGPDHGRVQAVDQDGLDLRELKRDPQGHWTEQTRRWRVGAAP